MGDMLFKNWLDTRPKMETHEPNLYSTILGGVSRGFWSRFLDWGARSGIFWHVKTGTFARRVVMDTMRSASRGWCLIIGMDLLRMILDLMI